MERHCKKHKEIAITIVILIGIFLIALIISTGLDIRSKLQESENTITVSDTGTIYAKPDLVLTTFSVITEADTVSEALSENAEKMNAVIAFAKGEGVEEKDLKTTNFNIYPRYEWHESTKLSPQGERVLVGYEVRQSLQVKIRDLEKTAQIIEGAAEAGSNQIGDLQFTIDNQDELKKEARDLAIEKAKAKAEELAKQLGVNLVGISNFSESSGTVRFYSMDEAAGKGGGGLDIEAGENKIEVTVNITYEIN